MTNKTSALARLTTIAAAGALFASACGSETTTSTPLADTPAVEANLINPPASTTPATTTPVTTTPATTTPVTTLPVTTAPVTTLPAPPDEPSPPAPPAPVDEVIPNVPTCGEFGPIPPVPDSMPTKLFDTDGDGSADDEVTAYGSVGGWKLRVVQNGLTSEAGMPTIAGFAAISGSDNVDGHDHISVEDFENGTVYTFATNDTGCVELVSTVAPPLDGIVAVPVTVPTITPIDDVLVAQPIVAPCGLHVAIPADAPIGSDILVDIAEDGSADDRLVSYLDGDWKLRAVVGGVVSELVIDGVGPHSVQALGLANVAGITSGPEVIAKTGGGAYTSEIGVFGFTASDCLFRFSNNGGVPFGLPVGASVSNGSGAICGDGYIGAWGYQLDPDDTYSTWDAAFEESTEGQLSYMLNSDGHDEGLSYDDLTPAVLDCDGISL